MVDGAMPESVVNFAEADAGGGVVPVTVESHLGLPDTLKPYAKNFFRWLGAKEQELD